jgi:hypothetical protein
MKYIALTFVAVLLSIFDLSAQFVSEMVEYHPAPGQLINTDCAGSYNAARSVVGSENGLVSLGSFGGNIVFGFDHPVMNDPANPYGVDFVIFGNPQPDWAEPGIVMVMKDQNKNGKADDTWYELAGSDYFFSTTKHQFSVTYTNSLSLGSTDVSWFSSESKSGAVLSNIFHKQPFFPSDGFFNGNITESLSFSGTCISDQVDLSVPESVRSYHRKFGYADNILKKNYDLSLPDNPYTSEIEGCGGDAMDIGWAVDANGNYIELDQIDFVKIYTGVLANAGWLGEISTEICGITDIPANVSVTGISDCIVINYVPKKLFSGDSCYLEAKLFHNGRLLNERKVVWSVDNSKVASVSSNGLLVLKQNGKLKITAAIADNQSITSSLNIEVITPSEIEIILESSSIRIDEKTEIKTQVKDALQNVISGVEIEWTLLNNNILFVSESGGRNFIKGLSEGGCLLEAHLKNRPELKSSVTVNVLSESLKKEVFLTVNDQNSTLVPLNKIEVKNFNLNPFVDHRQGDYDINTVQGVTVAHVLAQSFVNLGFADDFRFRDDDRGGNSLYIWKVPKGDPSNVEYVYGYGGSTESAAFSKSWVVLLNGERIVTGFDNYPMRNGDELVLCHVSEFTSFSQEAMNSNLKIWPQPATDLVHVTAGNKPITSIKLFDSQGRLMLMERGWSEKDITFNTNGFDRGIFILQICTEQRTFNGKIILQ